MIVYDNIELPTTRLEQVEMLKSIAADRATGTYSPIRAELYAQLIRVLRSDFTLKDYLPDFVHHYRTLDEFWTFIKHQAPTYRERTEIIRKAFLNLLDYLEKREHQNVDSIAGFVLNKFNSENITLVWNRATQRIDSDPEGAITSARTLLETVCKHILTEYAVDESSQPFDLPALYDLTAKKMDLAPAQHTREAFKKILGGCTTVVHNLATLRKNLSDAHGRSPGTTRPAKRHARLAVNLAGSMAIYLIETFEDRQSKASLSA